MNFMWVALDRCCGDMRHMLCAHCQLRIRDMNYVLCLKNGIKQISTHSTADFNIYPKIRNGGSMHASVLILENDWSKTLWWLMHHIQTIVWTNIVTLCTKPITLKLIVFLTIQANTEHDWWRIACGHSRRQNAGNLQRLLLIDLNIVKVMKLDVHRMQNHLSNFDGDDSEDYRNKTMLNHLCSHDDISWPGLDIHVVLGGVVYSNFFISIKC